MQDYNTNSGSRLADYDRELNELYSAITGRKRFTYRAASDPLYRAYADRYIQDGRLAMRDTMGQAAHLTGGYGSSYSQAVGQQTYDEYLRKLSDVMPELYATAYQQYADEGERLNDAYDRLYRRRADEYEREAAQEAQAYQRSRDAVSDERYAAETAAAQDKTDYSRRQDSYAALVKLISTAGYQPTDAELQAAGLSREAAQALYEQYLRENGLLPAAQTSYTAPASPAKSSGAGKKTQTKKSVSTVKGGGGGVSVMRTQ